MRQFEVDGLDLVREGFKVVDGSVTVTMTRDILMGVATACLRLRGRGDDVAVIHALGHTLCNAHKCLSDHALPREFGFDVFDDDDDYLDTEAA